MANPVTQGSGALTGLTLDEDDNKDKPVVYGVYQLESQDAPNVNLQDVYGTAAMPVFEWVKTISNYIKLDHAPTLDVMHHILSLMEESNCTG